MNIIKVENVRSIDVRENGMTVLHDYKMGGGHNTSSIIILNEKDMDDSELTDKLRGYYIDALIIPKGMYLSPELYFLLQPSLSKKFKMSYY